MYMRVRPISLITKIIPTDIRRLGTSGKFPMDMIIPPLKTKYSRSP